MIAHAYALFSHLKSHASPLKQNLLGSNVLSSNSASVLKIRSSVLALQVYYFLPFFKPVVQPTVLYDSLSHSILHTHLIKTLIKAFITKGFKAARIVNSLIFSLIALQQNRKVKVRFSFSCMNRQSDSIPLDHVIGSSVVCGWFLSSGQYFFCKFWSPFSSIFSQLRLCPVKLCQGNRIGRGILFL